MWTLRRSEERGQADLGWLKARYSFSFANYQDPKHIRFRTLRVINEDRVQPSTGFGTHGHEDMEILTYVLGGAVEHKDSTGEHGILRPGDIQVMSAGTGVQHSEMNPSPDEELHLMQIWIFPDKRGYEPSYQETRIEEAEKIDVLKPIVSGSDKEGTLSIRQDVEVYASMLSTGAEVTHTLADGRGVWIQNPRGRIEVTVGGESVELAAGDGLSLETPGEIRINGLEDAEFLLFDLG